MADEVFDQALGAYEASALMGVHFTYASKQFRTGKLRGIACKSVHSLAPSRQTVIYDGKACEQNYREWEKQTLSGKVVGHPRKWAILRPKVLRHLKAVKVRIAFHDAMSIGDAAIEMKVNWTLVARMLRQKKLVGRLCWSERSQKTEEKNAKLWIVSRQSVLANMQAVRASEAAGTKRGVKRKT